MKSATAKQIIIYYSDDNEYDWNEGHYTVLKLFQIEFKEHKFKVGFLMKPKYHNSFIVETELFQAVLRIRGWFYGLLFVKPL